MTVFYLVYQPEFTRQFETTFTQALLYDQYSNSKKYDKEVINLVRYEVTWPPCANISHKHSKSQKYQKAFRSLRETYETDAEYP